MLKKLGILSRLAKAIDFHSFSVRTLVTGNTGPPTLALGDRTKAISEFGLKPVRKQFLVMGSSQGAHAINEAVLKAFLTVPFPDAINFSGLLGEKGTTRMWCQGG